MKSLLFLSEETNDGLYAIFLLHFERKGCCEEVDLSCFIEILVHMKICVSLFQHYYFFYTMFKKWHVAQLFSDLWSLNCFSLSPLLQSLWLAPLMLCIIFTPNQLWVLTKLRISHRIRQGEVRLTALPYLISHGYWVENLGYLSFACNIVQKRVCGIESPNLTF